MTEIAGAQGRLAAERQRKGERVANAATSAADDDDLLPVERENEKMRRRIAELEALVGDLNRDVPPAERDELAAVQARADAVAMTLGERAPVPSMGENARAYRLRVLRQFQRHSTDWGGGAAR